MLNKTVVGSASGATIDVMNSVSSVAQAITGTLDTFGKAVGTLNLKASAMYAKAEVDTQTDVRVHAAQVIDRAALKLATEKRAIASELANDKVLSDLFKECKDMLTK